MRKASHLLFLFLLSACSALPPDLFETAIPQQTEYYTQSTAEPAETVVVDADKLTLRACPSESCPPVKYQEQDVYLDRGEELHVLSCKQVGEDWWYQVVGRYGAGWVAGYFNGSSFIFPLDVCG